MHRTLAFSIDLLTEPKDREGNGAAKGNLLAGARIVRDDFHRSVRIVWGPGPTPLILHKDDKAGWRGEVVEVDLLAQFVRQKK